jgi:ferrous iron transport protein A
MTERVQKAGTLLQNEKPILKPLSEVQDGKRCTVRQLDGGGNFMNRLSALGFTIGAEVVVIQNYGRGPLIAMARGSRVALGRGEAMKVLVEEFDDDR